ncbi:nucleotidyltransferase domain-containing protein, partial [Streptomyces longwoodensis]|uniref:nucleotidyltransferase domain-containing protein n=1 Tax=Streptomyces longwoodensis TaxID=68231 RepID=UPI003F5627A4
MPPAFRPVVAAARERLRDVLGARLHSAYLYGSVPRGTARVGRSDLDLLVALHEEPTDTDREDLRAVERTLDAEFEQVDGVGALLYSRARVLSELERYDLGWFVACLCTPLLGPVVWISPARPTAPCRRPERGPVRAAARRRRAATRSVANRRQRRR